MTLEVLRWKLGIHAINAAYIALAVVIAVAVLTVTAPVREWLKGWIHLLLWGALPPGG